MLVPSRPPEPLPNRLQYCLAMLGIHSMLSDAELRKARARFDKEWELVQKHPKGGV